jgi:hypothetical protein
MAVPRSRFEMLIPVPVQNMDSVTIPAYGAMLCNGTTTTADGVTYQKVYQPSTTFSRDYLINGISDIPANGFGVGYTGDRIMAACDYAAAVGDGVGFKQGQSTLSKNYPGARVIDLVDDTNNFAWVTLEPITSLLAKSTGSWSSGLSQVVNIWIGAGGSETVSSGPMTVTAWNRTSVTIPTGKFCKITFINGVAYSEPWEC